jgi:hypothetical protein
MAPKNKELDKVEKKYEEFAKLQKKGADPCDLAKKAEDYFRAPVKVLLIEEGELKLKKKFESLIEDLTEACDNK